MAWSDQPTEKQVGALLNMIRWQISDQEVPSIINHLMEKTTRQELSNELGRIRELKINRKLDKDNVFNSGIWIGYRKRKD